MILILKTDFEEVLNNFFRYKKGKSVKKDNYMLRFVHNTLPKDIRSNIEGDYIVKGSVGKGIWADCPTVAILDSDITTSTQHGIYLVYLFKSDMSGVYLSFEWGTYQFNNNKDNLHEAVSEIRTLLIDSHKIENFELTETMDLVSNAARPKSYEAGAIVFKYYPFENFPEDEILINDLNEYLELYDFVKQNYEGKYANLLKESSSDDIGSSEGIGDEDVKTHHYWLCSPGPNAEMWDEFYEKEIIAIGWPDLGNLSKYDDKEEIKLKLKEIHNDNLQHVMDTHTIWQFANEINEGDIIFAKKGMGEIIGRGIVQSNYEFNENYEYYPNIRQVKWTHKGNWAYEKAKLPVKTLTDITNYKEDIEYINELISNGEVIERPVIDTYPEYLPEKFLEEVYITEDEYWTLRKLLFNKKNLIIQGAPGVGKTFMAKRLAYSIMEVKDTDRVMMVQFHQSYSYEDFVMGYRPSKEGFDLRDGSFYSFCKQAEEDSENDYFFIIDEINRGNLSKIFGELFMLIENDKRGEKNKIQLLYTDESFFIPKNVYIIGLMNTADRSLAMIDYALRRRFAFFDLKPGFDSNGFNDYQTQLNNKKFNKMVEVMKELNQEIKEDESLGEGFRIGHSYLCNIKSGNLDEKLNFIVEYEIIPLLKEYWFDELEKVERWSEKLRSVINDSTQDDLY